MQPSLLRSHHYQRLNQISKKMKNFTLKILTLALLAFALHACEKNDESLTVDHIIGNWMATQGDNFISIYLHDEEIGISDFGMIVFGLNEESAEAYAKNYLQAQVLGPIDVNVPAIVFKEEQTFLSQKAGESVEGNWQWMNDKQYLRINPEKDPLDHYNFTIEKLNAAELILRYDATIEILGGQENQVYPFSVIIKLKR
jgi:hypothetical protein